MVLIMGFILKLAAPTIDDHYSSRPVAAELKRLGTEDKPIAVFNARRELRYGLAFYRNQNVFSYEESPIPAIGHVLVARFTPERTREDLEHALDGRKLLKLGSFPAQKVEYFWVSPQVR
jgi:hypothetical protein